MSSDSKTLRHNFTASLGRVPGVDFDDLATGPLSLVADHRSEHPKSSVVGRQCEVRERFGLSANLNEEDVMELIVERADVWAASIKDEPGGLAWMLNGLREVGADLDCIIARRSPDKPGTGVVFVTPLRGDAEVSAAADLGFNVTNSVHSVRVEGENEPGVAAELAGKLAEAGLNLRGLTASVLGTRFVFYIGLDTVEDAAKALDILQKA